MKAQRIAILAALVPITFPVAAQTPRDALVEGIRQYQELENEAAEQSLMIGLNPSLGTADVLWPQAVWRLADLQIGRGDIAAAQIWLRWAVRLEPNLEADEQTPSAVVRAIEDAKTYARSGRREDGTIHIEHIWTSSVGTVAH